MIMETETNTGFGSDKATVVSDGGGLGLKLQRTESFPYKMMMTMHHHRPFEGGSGGPTFYNGINEGSRSMNDIYDVVAVGGGGGAVARTLQPFNTAFKSPGGMAASLRFPFTSAQWQELERQALIYKYMMASAPIPPDLLIPISRNFSDTAASHSTLGRGSCFNLRFSNNTDPEPGRCRRTDGKKWRCSRDVAPDQKYCERHMHRGRPRSRKPVEVHAEINNNNNSNITRSVPPTTITANNSSTSSHHLGATRPYHQSSGFLAKPDFKVPSLATMASATAYKEPRYMEWMVKGETAPMAASNQQWQQLMQSKVGLKTDSSNCNANMNTPVFQYQDNLNLNSYTEFGSGEGSGSQQQQNDQSCLFFNPELASLENPVSSDQRQVPRRLIDAWSTANARDNPKETNNSSVSSNGKLPLSTLTLSMSGGNGTGEDMNQIQMGLGVIDSDRDNGGGVKSQPLSWMTPASWIASPPGGPLAEVLQSSTTAAAAGSNSASPHACSSTTSKSSSSGGGLNLMTDGWGGSADASSPLATTVSSPSGVLQKALASLSDSSGSSSPTFTAATAAAKSEIALQWMKQSKLPYSS